MPASSVLSRCSLFEDEFSRIDIESSDIADAAYAADVDDVEDDVHDAALLLLMMMMMMIDDNYVVVAAAEDDNDDDDNDIADEAFSITPIISIDRIDSSFVVAGSCWRPTIGLNASVPKIAKLVHNLDQTRSDSVVSGWFISVARECRR